MKQKYLMSLIFSFSLFLILISPNIILAQKIPEPIAITICSTNTDCDNLCQQLDSCRIKSCYAKCENGDCKRDIEYYYPDASLMMNKTKEFIISHKGENYFNNHFVLRAVENYTEGRGGNVGYKLIFNNTLGEDLIFYGRFDFDICKEEIIRLEQIGDLFDKEDFEISRQQAVEIAENEGLKSPFSVSYTTSNYNRPIWIVETGAEVEIGELREVAIDMNGTIFYKSTRSLEVPETGEVTPEPRVEEPPFQSGPPLYTIVGIGIVVLISIIYFLLKRRK